MIRKFLAFVALCCGISSISNAQEYSVSANPVDSFTYGNVHYMVLYNYLVDNAADSIAQTWRIISTQIPAGWIVTGYCDNIDCFGDLNTLNGTNTHIIKTIGYSEHCQLALDVIPAAATINEMAVVKVRMQTTKYNGNDTLGQVDTLVYRINPQQTTGIATVSSSDSRIKIWPNPAKESIFIFADKMLDASNLAIINVIGQTVYTTAINSENSNINIHNLAKGLYMIQMTDDNGRMITARKFIKE